MTTQTTKIDYQTKKLHIPFKEKLKSIPEIFGIRVNEEPFYKVIKKDGHFEIRRYSTQVIAKLTLQELSFDQFREAAFKRLAAYIFGENKRSIEVSMTSPVMQQKKSEDVWTMSFILPSKYNLKNAPVPRDPNILLEELKPFDIAAVAYSGNNTLGKIKDHEAELSAWLKKQVHLKTIGNFIIAQYDAPFVLPFVKRNEVQIRVDKAFH